MEAGLRETLLSGIANRQTIIHFPNGEYPDITEGIYSGSLKIEEILCAGEEMVFGECNASRFEAQIAGIDDISNLMIYVYQRVPYDQSDIGILITQDGTEIITHNGENILVGRRSDYILPLFYGRVDTAVLQTDRIHRVITAYDELYFNGDVNCAEWYADFFAISGSKTLKTFRDSLFNFIGIEQESTTLVSDDIVLEETMETTALKFADIIKAVCQINGCFGHIDRSGVFRYIQLYANRPVEVLGTQDGSYIVTQDGAYILVDDRRDYLAKYVSYDVSDNYRSNESEFESYTVKKIDKLQIRAEEDDLGAVVGTGNNPYVIQGNFLVWGKGATELNTIATRIFNIIKDIEYRPCSVNLIYSEPYITVGDIINLTTKRDGAVINSYVLKNYLSFNQLFHQNLVAEGSEYKSEVVDDVNAEINQLKGKTIKIVKNVEEFLVRLDDLDVGYSAIEQKVNGISLAVADLENNYAAIDLKVNNISLTVSNIEGDMSLIEQSVNKVTIAVERKVDVGTVSNQLSVETEQIKISGNRLVIDTTNFQLSADGSMSCSKAEITGGSFSVSADVLNETKITVQTTDGLYATMIAPYITRLNGPNSNVDISTSHIGLYYGSDTVELNRDYLIINDGAGTEIDIGLDKITYRYGGTTSFEVENSTGNVNVAGYLDVVGTVYYGDLVENSDIRLKKDFTVFDGRFIDFFLKLNPLMFKMIKDESEGFRTGLIAQEVIQAFEECGIDYTQQAFVKQKDDGYYALNYNYVFNLAVYMIQQLYKRLEALQDEIKQ